jgi:hypothetical protein
MVPFDDTVPVTENVPPIHTVTCDPGRSPPRDTGSVPGGLTTKFPSLFVAVDAPPLPPGPPSVDVTPVEVVIVVLAGLVPAGDVVTMVGAETESG